MRRINKLLLLITLFSPILLFGQNDIQLSQQFLSRTNYNPAATGASNYMNVYLLARQQFIGFKDAPSTQVLNAHNYFDQINSGMGLVVINDKMGVLNSFNAKVGYAYHIHFENTSYLSMGINAGILYKGLSGEFIAESPNDDLILEYQRERSGINPDFDFGLEYNTEAFQIGASVTHLNVPSINIDNFRSGRHYYFHTKYTFKLDYNAEWKLVPHLVANMSSWPIGSFELNTMAYYKSRFWFGASMRTSDEFKFESLIGIVGLFVTDFIRLGYSYDYNLSNIRKYSGGSHEIMLSVRLGRGDSGYGGSRSPRFFFE